MMRSAACSLLLLTLILIPACGDEGDTNTTNITGGVSAPAPGTLAVLTDSNAIYFVNPSDPGTLIRGIAVTNIPPTALLRSIDFRPSTKELYALDLDGGNRRLHTIDTVSGFALRVGVNSIGTTADKDFDFSPVSGLMRFVDASDVNLRVNPDTLAATPDVNLTPDSDVVAAAYTNNVAGAAVTTLYGIDFVDATLVRIGGPDGVPSPNGGVVTLIGPLGVLPGNNEIGFDIAPSGTAYASWVTAGGIWRLYTINLATGAATEVGVLGNGGRVLGIAVVP
jgi:hypothetical protein